MLYVFRGVSDKIIMSSRAPMLHAESEVGYFGS